MLKKIVERFSASSSNSSLSENESPNKDQSWIKASSVGNEPALPTGNVFADELVNDDKSSNPKGGAKIDFNRRSHPAIKVPSASKPAGFIELVFDMFDRHSAVKPSVKRAGMRNSASFSGISTTAHCSSYENEIYSSTGSGLNKSELEISELIHETNNVLFANRNHSDKTLHLLNELRR